RIVLAILDGGLRAFLVVDDEVHREPRPTRPFRIGRVAAIADVVALHLIGHAASPSRSTSKGATSTNSSSVAVPSFHMKTAKRPGWSITVKGWCQTSAP